MSKIEEKELEVLQEQEKKKGAILHDLGSVRHATSFINAHLCRFNERTTRF